MTAGTADDSSGDGWHRSTITFSCSRYSTISLLMLLNSGVVRFLGLDHGISTTSLTVVGLFVRTTTLSERYTASSTEWVMNMMVCLVFLRISISCACIRFLVWASNAPNGSSIRITSGSTISALAIPTRCFMPPESSLMWEFANFSRPTMRRYSSALALRSAFGTPAISSPSSTLLLTVRQGSKAKSWNTIPLSLPGPTHSLSPTYTTPEVGGRRPAIRFRSVVLPQPDGPMNDTSSPFLTSIEISSMAFVSMPFFT